MSDPGRPERSPTAVPIGVTLVLPIKATVDAKSRLDLSAAGREIVMRSFVEHVVGVARASRHVARIAVVGSVDLVPDPVGVRHLPEPQLGGGLNAVVTTARHWACLAAPDRPIAVLPVDLPRVTAAELDLALRVAEGLERAFVPDADGTGTTLITARRPELLISAYGPGSAAEHERLGLVRLDGAGAGLRHDVDTLDDLRSAAPALEALAG